MIWWYLVPGVYHFRTRLRSPRVTLFWLVNVVGVIAVVGWLASGLAPAQFAVVFVLALAALQGIYEVGYLENDLVTTASERNPTLRLAADEREAVRARYGAIVALKTLVSVALVAALWVVELRTGFEANLLAFSLWLVALRLVYLAHNATRGRIAIVTFAGLQVAKFGAVPLLLLDPSGLVPYLLIACIPVPMAVAEYAALPRYGYARFVRIAHPYPRARVVYYATLSMALAIAASLWGHASLRVATIVALGLLAFRALAWLGVLLVGPPGASVVVRSRGTGGGDDD